jgi:hypothetical protein
MMSGAEQREAILARHAVTAERKAALDRLHGFYLAGACTLEEYLAVYRVLVEYDLDLIRDCLTDETPATPGGAAGDGRVER